MVLLFPIKILFILLVLQQLLITLYYKYYSLALLVLTFNCNKLLSTISYFYTFILYILLMQSLTNQS